jgi:hypothetical protein
MRLSRRVAAIAYLQKLQRSVRWRVVGHRVRAAPSPPPEELSVRPGRCWRAHSCEIRRERTHGPPSRSPQSFLLHHACPARQRDPLLEHTFTQVCIDQPSGHFRGGIAEGVLRQTRIPHPAVESSRFEHSSHGTTIAPRAIESQVESRLGLNRDGHMVLWGELDRRVESWMALSRETLRQIVDRGDDRKMDS